METSLHITADYKLHSAVNLWSSASSWYIIIRRFRTTDFVLLFIVTHPCCRHDIQATAAVYSTSHRLDVTPIRLSTVGRRAFPVLVPPPSGTTCLSTSHLRRHSRFSDNAPQTFLFSRSYQDTIIWLVCYYHHSSLEYCLDTCGPCSN